MGGPKMIPVWDSNSVLFRLNGDRVYGFPADNKFEVRRHVGGPAFADLRVLATSDWAKRLKRSIGHMFQVDVEYEPTVGGGFDDNIRFCATMELVGYTVTHTNEVPVFTFFFNNQRELQS